jgi:hypothetical protein
MASILKFDEWQNTAGVKRGTVLQTLSVFDNTHYTFNAGSANQNTFYNVTGLSISITPSSATSKILLMASVCIGQYTDGYNIYLRLARNGTGIGTSDSRGIFLSGGTAMVGWRAFNGYAMNGVPMNFMDSPATTSAVTYTVQVCNSGGSSYPSYVNRQHTADTNWPQAGSSNLIAMEIQA